MFDFYNIFYNTGYLSLTELKKALNAKVITQEEFDTITSKNN